MREKYKSTERYILFTQNIETNNMVTQIKQQKKALEKCYTWLPKKRTNRNLIGKLPYFFFRY